LLLIISAQEVMWYPSFIYLFICLLVC